MVYFRDMEQSIVAQQEDYLSMTVGRIDQMLYTIETHTAQWLQLNIGLVTTSDPNRMTRDYQETMRLANAMEVFKNSNRLVERIILYHGESKMALDNDYGIVKLPEYRYQHVLDAVADSSMQTGWHVMDQEGAEGSIAFISKLVPNQRGEQDVLVIVLSRQKLGAEINPMPWLLPGASVWLLSHEGDLYIEPEEQAVLPSHAEQVYLSANEKRSGVYRVENEKMASFAAVSNSGWTLFASGPRGEVLAGASHAFRRVASIMGASMLLCVLSIVAFSKWIYRPFQDLLDTFMRIRPQPERIVDEVAYLQDTIVDVEREKVALMDRWQAVSRVAVQQYLHLLLRNDAIAEQEALPDALPLDSGVISCALYVEEEQCGDTFLAQEKPLAFSAIENVAQQLLDAWPRLHGYIVSQYPSSFALIFFPENTMAEDAVRKGIGAFWLHLVRAISKQMDVDMTFGVGRLYLRHADAARSYQEAQMAVRLHLMDMQPGELYFYEDAASDRKNHGEYPRAIETQIIAQLKEGRTQDAEASLALFANTVQESGLYSYCKQAYLVLLSGLVQALIRNGQTERILRESLFEAAAKCTALDALQAFFALRVFPLFARGQQQDSDENARRIVCGVRRFVVENVTRDVSLQQCAEAVGVSASYVSRTFKRVGGVSFLEYVTRVKIDYVKERLLSGDDNIGEIAQQVGYSERNLYRTFVKLEGISPGSFREEHRK